MYLELGAGKGAVHHGHAACTAIQQRKVLRTSRSPACTRWSRTTERLNQTAAVLIESKSHCNCKDNMQEARMPDVLSKCLPTVHAAQCAYMQTGMCPPSIQPRSSCVPLPGEGGGPEAAEDQRVGQDERPTSGASIN